MRTAIKAEVEACEVQHNGWILDGFPRMVAQVVLLMNWTSGLPLFVYLDVSEWTCLERLSGRDGRDRVDDNADSIARKFENFREHTLPMVNMLDSGGVLHTIDGERPTREIASVVETLLS